IRQQAGEKITRADDDGIRPANGANSLRAAGSIGRLHPQALNGRQVAQILPTASIDICLAANAGSIFQISANHRLSQRDGQNAARGIQKFLRVLDSQHKITVVNILQSLEYEIAQTVTAYTPHSFRGFTLLRLLETMHKDVTPQCSIPR